LRDFLSGSPEQFEQRQIPMIAENNQVI